MAGAPHSKSILLTGATGFLGSNLLKSFVGLGHRVVALRRKTSDCWRITGLLDAVKVIPIGEVPLSQVFAENAFDAVVHCATSYGRRPTPATEIIEANLILPLHLLEYAQSYGVKGFINTDTILDKRVSSYALSKKQFVDWLEQASGSIACMNVALEHFYGPFDDRSKFVSNIILSLLRGDARIDLTPGAQKRDFVYIDDVVAAMNHVIEFGSQSHCGFFRFEVGSNQLITIRDFVSLVRDLTGNKVTHLDFGAVPYRPNEVMESHVDTRALGQLGWSARVSLRDGLLRTIEMERKRLNA